VKLSKRTALGFKPYKWFVVRYFETGRYLSLRPISGFCYHHARLDQELCRRTDAGAMLTVPFLLLNNPDHPVCGPLIIVKSLLRAGMLPRFQMLWERVQEVIVMWWPAP
jgi:hypothetical protein